MALPIRTTVTDVETVCGYLATKPTGATHIEAKAVLDAKVLDSRKLSALRYLGLIEDQNGKLRLTDAGRYLAKDKGARRAEVLKQRIATVPAYQAVVERAVHKAEFIVSATEIASHWHLHFSNETSDNDKILNDQAVCFFQLAEGADLGAITVGRKGQPTRFTFDEAAARAFADNGSPLADEPEIDGNCVENIALSAPIAKSEITVPEKAQSRGNRVFITHGKNQKILDQVKEIVAYGKFLPVIAKEHETGAKSVPDKVMDDMRSCQAAVIHVGVEGMLYDKDEREHPQVNGNVLIEIGAAMALYGKNFILLVEDGVKLPSNLQGLYECRYRGDELSAEATMKLLKAFNAFN
jgi:predicted nucleotide-binding protein